MNERKFCQIYYSRFSLCKLPLQDDPFSSQPELSIMKLSFSKPLFFLITLSTSFSSAQTPDFARRLFDSHENYREVSLNKRRFKQKDILPLIEKRKADPRYQIESVGQSFEGKNIQMVKVGAGPRKVLLWTQMHGDEPTATMATFDILNFLEGKNDGFDDFRKQLLENTTLYFVPMLNPDGAERYQRRNAQEIDINRDALALQAPESRILKQLQQTLLPEFGFNLHDKNPRYSVGNSDKLATISFLATAFDQERNVNAVREKSMQVIVGMDRVLQEFIPGQVGRWNEDFEPRAFGDNIQKWGTTLILIESGGYAGDPEKQYIRKLNFVAILSGLGSIADNSFVKENKADYYKNAENSRYIYDLLIKKATVQRDGKSYQADFGINRYEVSTADATDFFYRSVIEEYGDLSIYSGTQTLDAEGYILEYGKVYPEKFTDLKGLTEAKAWSILKQGFTYIQLNGKISGVNPVQFPLHILNNKKAPNGTPALDDAATFILKKEGKIKYAVVNGFVYDLEKEYSKTGNGIVD